MHAWMNCPLFIAHWEVAIVEKWYQDKDTIFASLVIIIIANTYYVLGSMPL